jgi:hypothetical protein
MFSKYLFFVGRSPSLSLKKIEFKTDFLFIVTEHLDMVKPIYLLSTPAFVCSLPIDLTKHNYNSYNEFGYSASGEGTPFVMGLTSRMRDFIFGNTLNQCAFKCASQDSFKGAVKCTRDCFIKTELNSAMITIENVRQVLKNSAANQSASDTFQNPVVFQNRV